MNLVTLARTGGAPRTLEGLRVIEELLADGQWHPYREAVEAAETVGLATRTCENIIRAASKCRPVVLIRRGPPSNREVRRA